MSGVMARLGRRGRGDRGGVATITAVLLAGGVLLGMTALVVDVGRIYVEREELQSGADAAAYAVALDCAKGRQAACAGGVDADGYADDNAKDQYGAAYLVCGNDGTTGTPKLPACGPGTAGNLTDCIGGPVAPGVKYVEVHTKTEMPSGDFVLPYVFAQTISGGTGTTVGACARVAWGPPGGGLGITFSLCEWNLYTNNGTNLAPLGTTDPAYEHAIVFHDPSKPNTPTCVIGSAGQNLPGGFGFTDQLDGECKVLIDPDGTYGSLTGGSGRNECEDPFADARASGEPQAIPVFEDYDGSGAHGEYTAYGVAAFVITGYRFPSFAEEALLHSRHLCNPSEWCLYGYFTRALLPASTLGTGRDLGAIVIKTIG